MNCGSIINSDEIFRKLATASGETKRWLVGKYSTGDTYETDFTQSVYRYNGHSICSNKFDFSVEGTKCYWCNTFSFLFDDGEIIPDVPIVIESGVFKGTRIMIKRYPKCQSIFGKYKPDRVNFTSNLIPINDMIEKQRMINQSCEISHKLAISSLINSSEYPFKANIIGAWLCDTTNIIQRVSEHTLMETVFTDRMMRNTFFQLFVLAGTNLISHGSPSHKVLSIMNEMCTYNVGQKKIEMNTTLFVEPGRYSSFAVDYNKRRLFFVGNESSSDIVEPDWNIEYNLSNCVKGTVKLTKSPCIPEYLQMRVATIRVTHEIMEYIRKTGVNVFPSLYLFIYITIILLNRSFYNAFVQSNLYEPFTKIFIEDDLSKYLTLINNNIGNDLDENQIIQLLIDSELRIRLDANRILGGLIISLY